MEKKRRRIPLKPGPEFSGKPGEKADIKKESNENTTDEVPEPGELTQEKEDPRSGNTGKNNAGGYE